MDIYNYETVHNTYIGKSKADPDPLDKDNWLIPANAVTVKPPKDQKDKIQVWNGEAWQMFDDFRGVVYWTPEGVEIKITEIGHTVPENSFSEQPDLRTLEEAIFDAIELIKSRHARVLSDLSGNTTVEERDTWPLQKEWATKFMADRGEHEKNLLLGLLTKAELTQLGENAADAMAQKIISKSAAMDQLTSKAGGLKREAEEALNSIISKEQIPFLLESLENQMNEAISAFVQSSTGG